MSGLVLADVITGQDISPLCSLSGRSPWSPPVVCRRRKVTNISQHSTSTRAGLDLAGLDFDKTGIVFYKGRDI